MSKLDKHYKCSKELKTIFALSGVAHDIKRSMMEVEYTSTSAEYVVEPRSVKQVSDEGKKSEKKNRKANQRAEQKAA